MANKKRVVRVSKVFAHGAVKPVRRDGEWIGFGATSAGGDDYPVQFEVRKLPELIRWLQEQVAKDRNR